MNVDITDEEMMLLDGKTSNKDIMKRIALLKGDIASIPEHYQDLTGIWKVTTEGDCEGRTTKQIGYYSGNVIDIAYHLIGEETYNLCFHKVIPPIPEDIPPTNDPHPVGHVKVQFDIDSKTWDMKSDVRARAIKELVKLAGRDEDVDVIETSYFGCVEFKY